MALTLFYHPLSSYCHKVLIALYECGVEFTPNLIDLGNVADRELLSAHWPLCKFPVLHDSKTGRSLAESSIIIEYLNDHYPSARRLIPADRDAALEVRLWDRVFDNHLHTPMQQIVGDRITQAGADLSAQRALMRKTYEIVDRQVMARRWAASDDFSLADCAAAPALFYGTILEPLPSSAPNLAQYFDRLSERSSVRRTIEQARPYFQYFPFAEAIPKRIAGR